MQREDEAKIINFWALFNQIREKIIKCNIFRIFKIFDHKPGNLPQLLIHWAEGNYDDRIRFFSSRRSLRIPLRT